MARDYYMDSSDNEPSSSQNPSERECVVRYKGALPPTQVRNLMEQGKRSGKHARILLIAYTHVSYSSTAGETASRALFP